MIGTPALRDLRAAISAFHPMDDAAWAAFEPLVESRRLSSGDFFVEAGTVCRHVGFVRSGLLRAYYSTTDGDEMTTNFCGDGSFVCAYSSVLLQQPSRASIQALEDCAMLSFDAAGFRALFDRFPAWNHAGRRMIEGYYVFQEQRIADLLMLDAAARYEKFRKTHGTLAPRLQRQQIAAYLGITREALSRLGRRKPRKGP